jgi:hypothetical protein
MHLILTPRFMEFEDELSKGTQGEYVILATRERPKSEI